MELLIEGGDVSSMDEYGSVKQMRRVDHGRNWDATLTHKSVKDLIDSTRDCWGEYLYYNNGKQWMFCPISSRANQTASSLKPLTEDAVQSDE